MWRALLISIATCLSVVGAEWHVAPGAAGVGTAASPGSFVTAYAHTGWAASIAGGDIVWVHGGAPYTYSTTNRLVLAFSGSAGNMVTWKAWPYEKPLLHFGFNLGNRDYHRWEGLSFTDPYKSLRTNEAGWFDAATGTNLEWINITCINTPGLWTGTAGGIIRGGVFLYTGFDFREHITYPNVREFTGCVVGWPSGDAIELGTPGMIVASNIFFGCGITANTPNATLNITLGTNSIVRDNRFYEYLPLDAKGILIQNSSGSVLDGNIVAAPTPLRLGAAVGHSYTITNNTWFAARPVVSFVVVRTATTGTYDWDFNSYFDTDSAVLFSDAGVPQTFAEWKTANPTFDANSTASSATKPSDSVWAYRNVDDPYRIVVAIYNWTLAHNVTVTLTGMIQAGNTYRVKSFQDYEGALVQSGTFNGTSISLPMTNLAVAVPTWAMFQPTNTSPQFAAFEVVMGGAKASGMTFSGGVLK